MTKWISFADKWPPKTDYYYVCWNFKRPRIRKIGIEKKCYSTKIYFLPPKDLRDAREKTPTHWRTI